jgi:hypothetical protein
MKESSSSDVILYLNLIQGLNKTYLSSSVNASISVPLPDYVNVEEDFIEVILEKTSSSLYKISKALTFKISDIPTVLAPNPHLLCSETLLCSGQEVT